MVEQFMTKAVPNPVVCSKDVIERAAMGRRIQRTQIVSRSVQFYAAKVHKDKMTNSLENPLGNIPMYMVCSSPFSSGITQE